MPNEKLVDWIKSEEAQGYSDKQLRQYLIQQGYKNYDVDLAIKEAKSQTGFNAYISQFGNNFIVLLYIFLGLFSIELFAISAFALIFGSYILLIFPVILLFLIFNCIRTKKVSTLLNLIFWFSPIGLFGIFALHSLSNFGSSNLISYILFGVQFVMLGFISSYMYKKIKPDSKRHFRKGFFMMFFTALILSITRLIELVLAELSRQLEGLGGNGGDMSGIVSIFNENLINSNILFAMAFILIGGPFIYSYWNTEGSKKSKILLYIIPIILYFGLTLLFKRIVNSLIPGLTIP